jgi:hypothetical protein
MPTAIAIVMILGACILVLVSLLSVMHDLLERIRRPPPAQLDSRDID